jgi:DNA polymerase-3 subunit epsilon
MGTAHTTAGLIVAPPIPSPRERAIAWAREIAANHRAVFLDTETTALGPDAEIVDIAVIGLDGTVYLDTLVKPKRPIPAEATAVHGISDADVADAEPWSVVYGRFIESLADTVLIYNRDYDLTIINQCCRADDLPEFDAGDRWQCAMLAYADFDGAPGKFPGTRKWHKLDAAAARFGIPPGGHRALADAEACRQVVLAMARAEG